LDAMRRGYILAVLSVGSRSGFMRSGSGRVEDIVASIDVVAGGVCSVVRREARCDRNKWNVTKT